MINTRKTTQDILQEDLLRERAAFLARAGECLEEVLKELRRIEGTITMGMAAWRCGVQEKSAGRPSPEEDDGRLLRKINEQIGAFNRQREQARLRYYYLIVTREALGLIHHQRLEEIYRLPPKKRHLPER
jgi:hypothetical protein